MPSAPPRHGVRTWVDRDVEVTMADGTVLAMDVHRPDTDLTVGCLLQRVPYGKDRPAIAAGALDPDRALERGYAVAIQDCRGRGRSDGEFVPFEHESDDGADTIRWIAAQPWCNGEIGMFGRSYAAMCQWLLAGRSDLAELRAIAPMFSGSDPWRDWLRPDDVGEWGFVLLWSLRHLAPELLARRTRSGRSVAFGPSELVDWIDDITSMLAAGAGSADATASTDERIHRLAELVPLVAGVLAAERRSEPSRGCDAPSAAGSRVPTLVIGGWFDVFLRGTLDTWAGLTSGPAAPPSRLLIGPWAHGGTCPGTFAERDFGVASSGDAVGLTASQLEWFDQWMTHDDRISDVAPAAVDGRASGGARIFVTGADSWRDEPAWPPSDTVATRWHLTPGHDAASLDGFLRTSPPDATGTWELTWDEAFPVPTVGGQTFLPGLEVAANAGPRDQHELLGRSDILAFVSAVDPSGSTEILGTPIAVLSVSGAPRGTRWCVRLVDVGPTGWMLLGESAARSTGAADPVTVRLPDVAHTLAAGHRLGVVISHTSFPRYGRWVTAPHDGPPRRGSSKVHHGPSTSSWIELPLRHHQEVSP